MGEKMSIACGCRNDMVGLDLRQPWTTKACPDRPAWDSDLAHIHVELHMYTYINTPLFIVYCRLTWQPDVQENRYIGLRHAALTNKDQCHVGLELWI